MPKGQYDRAKFHGDLVGRVFGELTVVAKKNGAEGRSVYFCKCSCGNETEVVRSRLVKGDTRSCGHLVGKGHVTHGMTNTSTYAIWRSMLARCLRKTAKDYKNYGARGITVCDRWINSFEAFVEDMGVRPENKSLDRIDNEKGYCKENCRWATPVEQARNTRKNVYVYVDGEKMCAKEAVSKLGVSDHMLKKWISEGSIHFKTG